MEFIQNLVPFIMNHWMLCVALVVVLVLIFLMEQGIQIGGATAILPVGAVEMINHQDAKVVDVRSTDIYRSGHVVDSLNIPANELTEKPQKIEKYKNKNLIIVCANGEQSAKIAGNLKKQGFTQITFIKGGIAAWTMAELPLTK